MEESIGGWELDTWWIRRARYKEPEGGERGSWIENSYRAIVASHSKALSLHFLVSLLLFVFFYEKDFHDDAVCDDVQALRIRGGDKFYFCRLVPIFCTHNISFIYKPGPSLQ